MAGSSVIAFLSSGRCGTQWLAAGLRGLYSGLDVEHEPLGALYKPRRYFRCYSDPGAILQEPAVLAHVDRIERSGRPYVETGWPLFPVLPLLAARIPERLRVVHLTGHPVPSALAHVARGAYAGSHRDDAYTRYATLGPEDPGVFQPSYGVSWERLTPYEKCLFWWTELHLFGLELPGRQTAGIPFMRVKSEEVLSGGREALEPLLEFMGLPWRDGWRRHGRQSSARWQQPADQSIDPLEVHRHPTTAEVARHLGYDVGGLDGGALEAHYEGRALPGPDPVGPHW
jgi:hypothetical protein